jgi:hypothetical protein
MVSESPVTNAAANRGWQLRSGSLWLITPLVQSRLRLRSRRLLGTFVARRSACPFQPGVGYARPASHCGGVRAGFFLGHGPLVRFMFIHGLIQSPRVHCCCSLHVLRCQPVER